MNKEESLALFAQGREAWNAWAAEMHTQREALKAAGTWTAAATAHFSTWTAAATAHFSEHTFEDPADFTGFVFPGVARFNAATFTGVARFDGAKFTGVAEFRGATFTGDARFDGATFTGEAVFHEATFTGDAWFSRTVSGNAWFRGATFTGDAWFDWATFTGVAGFDAATFTGDVRFDGATFETKAYFRGIHGKNFSLARATFRAVPDFIQAHFTEAPRLDNLQITPRRVWPSTWAGVKAHFKGDPDLSARWRALKRLTVQGHDHEREQAFFKGELKSRRWSTDKPWNAAFWFGLLYQWLSDFGRSMVRPLIWWVVGVLGFACLYLGQHLALVGKSFSGFDWVIKRFTALAGSEAPPLSCMAGPGDPWSAALGLSLRKGLLFVGLDSTDKLNQIYGCLYGIYTDKTVEPDQLPDAFSPVIPDGIAFLGLLQLLYSAVVIFLFLLAVRNHFRIK